MNDDRGIVAYVTADWCNLRDKWLRLMHMMQVWCICVKIFVFQKNPDSPVASKLPQRPKKNSKCHDSSKCNKYDLDKTLLEWNNCRSFSLSII